MSVVRGRRVRKKQIGSTTAAPKAQPSNSMFTISNRTNFRAPIMNAKTISPASGIPATEAIEAILARRPLSSGLPSIEMTCGAERLHAAKQGTGKLASTNATSTMSPTPNVTEESSSPTSAAQPTERAHHRSACRSSQAAM